MFLFFPVSAPSQLDPGVVMLEERGHVPVVGVVPYMELSIDDEDSLSSRFDRREEGLIDIAVIRYPRISNFTDLSVLEPVNVSHKKHRCIQKLCQSHIDNVILPQIDLCRTTCAFDHDNVVISF